MLPFPLWYVFLVNGNQEPEIEKIREKASLLIHHDTYTLILFYWRDFIRAIISWFT